MGLTQDGTNFIMEGRIDSVVFQFCNQSFKARRETHQQEEVLKEVTGELKALKRQARDSGQKDEQQVELL